MKAPADYRTLAWGCSSSASDLRSARAIEASGADLSMYLIPFAALAVVIALVVR